MERTLRRREKRKSSNKGSVLSFYLLGSSAQARTSDISARTLSDTQVSGPEGHSLDFKANQTGSCTQRCNTSENSLVDSPGQIICVVLTRGDIAKTKTASVQALHLLKKHPDLLKPVIHKYVAGLGFPDQEPVQHQLRVHSNSHIRHTDWPRMMRIFLRHLTAKNTDKCSKVGRVSVFNRAILTLEKSRELLSSCVV
jgi:hypothetical protein